MSYPIEHIAPALSKLLQDPDLAPVVAENPNTAKWIIFSDHHRGRKTRNDDFLLCSRVYEHAMNYYNDQDYSLVLLGDVEEFWEVRSPKSVLKSYQPVYEAERQFWDHDQSNRYYRIFGNHDWKWATKKFRDKYASEFHVPVETIKEGLKLEFDGLGTLFLVHGHQGSYDGLFRPWLDPFLVRYFWTPIQKLTNYRLNKSPRNNPDLGEEISEAFYMWCKRNNVPLVFGHTHQAIFKSHYFANNQAVNPAKKAAFSPHKKLFNAGCSSFGDGSITGIEISDGLIKLVKWKWDISLLGEEQIPTTLHQCALEEIFK